jgi:hypothetical protein
MKYMRMMIPKNMLIVGISVPPELQCENRRYSLEVIAAIEAQLPLERETGCLGGGSSLAFPFLSQSTGAQATALKYVAIVAQKRASAPGRQSACRDG